MILRKKFVTTAILGLLAVTLSPAASSAQFVAGGAITNPLGGFPFQNPYFSYSRFAQRSYIFNVPGTGGTISATRYYSGSTAGYYRFYNRLPYAYYATYRNYIPPQSYNPGGPAAPFKAPVMNQGMIGNAQMQAQRNDLEGRKLVFDQWAYEKLGVQGLKDPALKNEPIELRKALTAGTEAEVASGEAINHILVADMALEKKGAKAVGVTLPPELLAQVNFGGSPSAEALNTLRAAGKLPFPPLFEQEKMQMLKEEIEKDFLAVAATASTGKAVNQNVIARLSDVVQRARDRVAPVARDLPFEEAIAARRFLNDLDGVAKLFRDNAMAGIVNPRWAAEGTTVPDLIKHMAKYKVLFGPAPKDGGEAYLALHRGLAAYHAALAQQAGNVKK